MKKLLLTLAMAAILPSMVSADTFDITFVKDDGSWPALGAYADTYTSNNEFGGSKWTITSVTNQNITDGTIRCGKKQTTDGNIPLQSTSAISSKINAVNINVTQFIRGTVSAAQVIVADDATFETNAVTYTSTSDLTTAGNWTINITDPQPNKFYKVNIVYTNTAKKNGVVSIDKYSFTYEAEAGVVAAPTMTPAAGWIMQGNTVALSGPEGASIFYTLDNSEPTENTSPYTEPIAIDQDLTMKAIARLNNVNSPVKEAAYKVYPINSAEAPLTPTQALDLIDRGFSEGIEVYIGGTVSNVASVDISKGCAKYTLKGEDNAEIYVYNGKYLEGADFTSEDQIGVGDKVVVKGKIKNYNGTKEVDGYSTMISIEKAPVTKCATPTFSIESGMTVTKGDVVTISTSTEGAVIAYTINGGEAVTSESNTVDVTINETCTIVATATKEGLTDSDAATAVYTVQQLAEGESEYTFDFTGETAYDMVLHSSTNESGTYNPETYTCTGENVTLTLNGQNRWWNTSNGPELRFHVGSSFTVAGQNEHIIIKKIELIDATNSNWAVEAATETPATYAAVNGYENGVWTGSQNSVTFKNTKTSKNTALHAIKVLYQIPSAVETIEAEDAAPVRYFNLQGVEVANPANGLFIKVQGKKATKVIL